MNIFEFIILRLRNWKQRKMAVNYFTIFFYFKIYFDCRKGISFSIIIERYNFFYYSQISFILLFLLTFMLLLQKLRLKCFYV